MKQYLDIVKEVLDAPETEWKVNRTGVKTKAISGCMIKHNMTDGFPLLTTKKMGIKMNAIELEFFIKGMTDKRWLQERGCHIWDDWCNPEIVPYGHTDIDRELMKAENDLGPVYGYQWRNFGGRYDPDIFRCGKGYDQFRDIVKKLKTDPTDRRMVCSAWNPQQLHQMALPPCHLLWQVIVTGEKLDTINLNWYQRSCDLMLGVPYDLALYGLLLELLAREANMKLGHLCGMFGDMHIYEDHIEGAKKQLLRKPMTLPQLSIPKCTNIYDWEHTNINLYNYIHHPAIKFPIAV